VAHWHAGAISFQVARHWRATPKFLGAPISTAEADGQRGRAPKTERPKTESRRQRADQRQRQRGERRHRRTRDRTLSSYRYAARKKEGKGMGPGSGLQDPRLLQAEPIENRGLTAGFKILESCRKNLEFESLDKRALQGASRSWCSAGRGTEREKKKSKTHGRPVYSDAAVNCTEDVSFLCDGPD
jgi:hypothetical protein